MKKDEELIKLYNGVADDIKTITDLTSIVKRDGDLLILIVHNLDGKNRISPISILNDNQNVRDNLLERLGEFLAEKKYDVKMIIAIADSYFVKRKKGDALPEGSVKNAIDREEAIVIIGEDMYGNKYITTKEKKPAIGINGEFIYEEILRVTPDSKDYDNNGMKDGLVSIPWRTYRFCNIVNNIKS